MTPKKKHTEKMTVQNLHYRLQSGKISLNPEYQRGSVWTRSQKQLLIDSLLHGIDIPKFYFREVNHSQFEHEVVDGQQRLRSICEFIDGEYKLPSDADKVDEIDVKGRDFKTLPTGIQMKLFNEQVDVVMLSSGYSDEDIEDMFLRLQNGTPLNAAEKRRAFPGNMRQIVADLATNSVFKLCAFGNDRFGHEDAAAKILHLMLAGKITDIRAGSIRKTYLTNTDIDDSHPVVKKANKAANFLVKAFKSKPSPKLKKYSVITLTFLAAEMLDKYTLSEHATEFGKCYLDFERLRIENQELPEDKRDAELAIFTDAARSDSVPDVEYRHRLLLRVFLLAIPELELKDPDRGFSEEQRLAIYLRDEKICKACGTKCEETDFHADHIKPHSKGGKTRISNGQLLCPSCNLKKGKKDLNLGG